MEKLLITRNNVKNLGQVYTPNKVVERMVDLIQNSGNILEPSSGHGVFVDFLKKRGKKATAVEMDLYTAKKGALVMDFFAYNEKNKFNTIIGNPPYVAYNDIFDSTLDLISGIDYLKEYHERTNLFIFFIRKAIEHLKPGGELIFITPRDFIKLTSSYPLNEFLYNSGTITHWFEYGDEVVFPGYSPNVVVWRFELDNFSRKTETNSGIKNFTFNEGQILFTTTFNKIKFSDLFYVKVGAASGSDKIFENVNGNREFVCSYTRKSGELKRMFYNVKNRFLEQYKEQLLNRKISKFTENNWWKWGRSAYESDDERIYVNCKTRINEPFFINDCKLFDGSVLGIFPKNKMDINKALELFNLVDWEDLGFKVGGRYIFSQRSLENCYLPDEFSIFLEDGEI